MNPLPNLSDLLAMTLRERATVFVNWVATRDPAETYDSCDSDACVFRLFAIACGCVDASGGNYGVDTPTLMQVLPRTGLPDSPIHTPEWGSDTSTMGDLLTRLRAYLERSDLKWDREGRESVW